MNPQIRAFIEMLKATIPADTPKLWQLTPPQAREQGERFFAQKAGVLAERLPGRHPRFPADPDARHDAGRAGEDRGVRPQAVRGRGRAMSICG
jgi:hypothetical protein